MNNKGTMEQKNKLIPELRFPEFVNDGEWYSKELNKILDYERPDNYIVTDTNYEKEGTPVLTANKSFVLGYTKETFGIYNNLPVIIFDDFTVDNKYVDFPFKVKSSAIKILKNKGADNLKFIYELMTQIKFNAIEHKRYYISEYQNLSINVPKPKEQQKIADCLSSLDELITAHNDKLESLKNHKKGLLQNLLYQAIRFKQINNQSYEDWKFVRFTDCCELIHGFQFREEHFTEKGIPIIKIGSLVDNGCLTFNNATYVDEKYRNSFSKFELKKGDILMALTGGTLGKVSRINDDYGLIFQNYRVGKFEPKDNAIKDFIYYILQSSLVQNKVKSLVNEAAQPNFGKQDFDKIEFFLPTIQEQQKIADCLTAVDHLITAQTEKVEQLKIHKKGLMQGLFPKIEE